MQYKKSGEGQIDDLMCNQHKGTMPNQLHIQYLVCMTVTSRPHPLHARVRVCANGVGSRLD